MSERPDGPVPNELIWLAFERSPSGTIVVDSNGSIACANGAALRIFGYSEEELLGQQVEVLVPDSVASSHSRLRDDYAGSPSNRHMGRNRILSGKRKDGSVVPVEVGLSPTTTPQGSFVIATVVDVTARLQAEIRLRESEKQIAHLQKLDALSTMAGGIAHEFNNILMGILGYAELLHDSLAGNDGALADIDAILKAAQRGRNVVAQLHVFTRRSTPPSSLMRLDQSVARALALLRTTLPANVSVESSLDPDTPLIVGHDGQVQQIVMNLGTNAARSMAGKPGTLTVSVYPSRRAGAADTSVKPGNHACVEVRDTGAGMSPEVRQRIFEPFFTTEGQSQASGLGLAVVHGIVRDHQGSIEVESEPGKGTVFRVHLPAEGSSAERVSKARNHRAPYRGMRALWVDDEPQLVALGKRQLAQWGIEVQTHSSSLRALEAFAAKPSEFDFVISDNMMPQMSGLEFIRQLKQLRPEIPALMVTGYSSDLSPALLEAHGVDLVLAKPFDVEQLQQALGDLLGSSSAESAGARVSGSVGSSAT